MGNKENIISVQWFRPEDEIYYFDGCEFIKASGRYLRTDDNGLVMSVQYFNDTYSQDIIDNENSIVFYPQMKNMNEAFMEAFDLCLENEENMNMCIQTAEDELGLEFDKTIKQFVNDLYNGKNATLGGKTYKPIGTWITEENSGYVNRHGTKCERGDSDWFFLDCFIDVDTEVQ